MKLIKKLDNIKKNKINVAKDTHIQVLISPEEGPNFAMRKFTIEAGGNMPKHTNSVEHQQFVLNGKAKVGIGNEIFIVEKDHVLLIPAGVPHWYETLGNEPYMFLCMIPNKEDKIEIIED